MKQLLLQLSPYYKSNRMGRPLAVLMALLVLVSPAGAAGISVEALQAKVSKANQYEQQKQYPQAITLYEEAVKESAGIEGAGVLKKNLSVLYANYGNALQDEKKFDEAEVYFDKALSLMPNERFPKEAKAANYYYRAMALKDAETIDYSAIRGHLQKAMETNPAEKNFRIALVNSYVAQARDLAYEDKLQEAAPLLEEARILDPDNQSAKQSLANVYFSMAKDAGNITPEEKAVQEQWLTKALAVDNSEQSQSNAKLIRQGAQVAPTTDSHGFLSSALSNIGGEGKAAKKAQEAQTMTARLAMVAQTLEVAPAADAPLLTQVETLETKVFGKKQDGALNQRVNALFNTVVGDKTGDGPVETGDNSYLSEIFKFTDGKVIRWQKFPLRVYVEEPPDELKGQYKPEYRKAVMTGIERWHVATNYFVSVVEVKNPQAADVQISWVEAYEDNFADPAAVPEKYRKYAMPKSSRLARVLSIASMFAPGYFGLAPQAIAAGLQYKEMKKLEVIVDESRMKIGLAPLRDVPAEQAETLLQNMAAREFGHVLGLKGYSPDEKDLMYPTLRSDEALKPSKRDVETLRLLYNRPANIVLNVR